MNFLGKTKAIGAQLLPFSRIGGNVTFPPPLLAILQTDGSYRYKEGKIASVLTTSDSSKSYSIMKPMFFAQNCTEMEWASIAHGLQFALEKGEEAIGIENDNLGVIGSLMVGKEPRYTYAKHYKKIILQLAKETVWTGVRWIPRERNAADKLFR